MTQNAAKNLSKAEIAKSSFANFSLIIAIFIVFYIFVIRPQQNKVKSHNNMLQSIKAGDTIVTTGGIIAKVKKIDSDDIILVEFAQNVFVKIRRSYIAEKI